MGKLNFLKKNLQLVSNDVMWCLYSLTMSVLCGSLRKPTLKDRTRMKFENPILVATWTFWYRSSPQQRPPKKSDSPSSCVRPSMKSLGRSTPCVAAVLHLGWQVFCEYSLSTGIRRLGGSVDSLFILTTLIMNMLKSKQDTQLWIILWICLRN